MFKKFQVIVLALALSLVFVLPALGAPGRPDFGDHVYVDGNPFGTKAVTEVPAPNENNEQSFDPLYVFSFENAPEGSILPEQPLVAESAPGDTDYNGGRWDTKTVVWTEEGFADHGDVPALFSIDDIELHMSLGHLEIVDGGSGLAPDYFECPLLPAKEIEG